ncbi:hypothetical protein D3C87_2128100 [compost metagenome]
MPPTSRNTAGTAQLRNCRQPGMGVPRHASQAASNRPAHKKRVPTMNSGGKLSSVKRIAR